MKANTFFILFLIICLAVLALCVYKIYKWYQRPENLQRFQEIKDRHTQLPPLIIKITRIRNRIAIGLCIYIIAEMIFFIVAPYSMKMSGSPVRHLLGYISIGVIFAGIFAGSMVTNKLWRCPACSKHLPVRVGRSGQRPVIIYSCPYCGHNLK